MGLDRFTCLKTWSAAGGSVLGGHGPTGMGSEVGGRSLKVHLGATSSASLYLWATAV